jgi:hypothetical protein
MSLSHENSLNTLSNDQIFTKLLQLYLSLSLTNKNKIIIYLTHQPSKRNWGDNNNIKKKITCSLFYQILVDRNLIMNYSYVMFSKTISGTDWSMKILVGQPE